MDSLSETKIKVMRHICRCDPNNTAVQIAGYGRAPWLSACRSLVRSGLAFTWRTGYYGLTDKGRAALEWHEHQATTSSAAPERDGGSGE